MKYFALALLAFLYQSCYFHQEKKTYNLCTIKLPLYYKNRILSINLPSLMSSESKIEFSDYNNDIYLINLNQFILGSDTAECETHISVDVKGPFREKSDGEILSGIENMLRHSSVYNNPVNIQQIKHKANGFRVFIVKYNSGFIATGVDDDDKGHSFYMDIRNIKDEKAMEEITNSLQIVGYPIKNDAVGKITPKTKE